MKLLKKLNTYLLENYPLAWHSKVIQLLVASLLIWVISFITGFGLVNLKVLQENTITNYYFNSSYILFHVIYCIIIIALWAISFYKNNAIKSLYPLQKGYFTKLFFHLFIPFTLLVSAYLPFIHGCNEKTQLLFNENEIEKDIHKLNLGYVFLVTDSTNYRINNRIYPSIYRDLTINSFDENEQKWKTENEIDNANTILVRNHKMQFYLEKTIYLDSNHCKSRNLIEKYYTIEELDNPELMSVLNFSNQLIDIESNSPSISFGDYSSIIFNCVRSKNYSRIEKIIIDFKNTCDKYQINNRINSKHIVGYLKFKDFKNIKNITKNEEYLNYDYDYEGDIQLINKNFNNQQMMMESMENQYAYFFEESNLNSMFWNYYRNEDNILKGDYLLIFLFLALGLSWLFIGFEFASIKNILITVPIGGVIVILNFIILFSVFRFNNMDDLILNSFIFTFSIIIGTTLFALKTKRIGKKYLNILITLTYIIAPILFVFIMGSISNDPHYTSYIDKCSHTIQRRYEDPIFAEPGFFFLYSLLGILLYFPLLKKWKAYED